MTPSESIIAFIKEMEGCRLQAYKCPANIMTIGYGTTHIHGTKVQAGSTITLQQADTYCRCDIDIFAQKLRQSITSGTIRLADTAEASHQFDAFVSFAYNLGAGNLLKSSLLQKHNAGDHVAAANEFLKWRYGGGVALPGLVRRRSVEATHYLFGMDSEQAQPYLKKAQLSSTVPLVQFSQPSDTGTAPSLVTHDDPSSPDTQARTLGIFDNTRYKELEDFFNKDASDMDMIY